MCLLPTPSSSRIQKMEPSHKTVHLDSSPSILAVVMVQPREEKKARNYFRSVWIIIKSQCQRPAEEKGELVALMTDGRPLRKKNAVAHLHLQDGWCATVLFYDEKKKKTTFRNSSAFCDITEGEDGPLSLVMAANRLLPAFNDLVNMKWFVFAFQRMVECIASKATNGDFPPLAE